MLTEMIKYMQVADGRIMKALHGNEHIPAKAISLFSHVLNAQHIWASRILGKASLYAVWEEHLPQEFSSIAFTNFEMLQDILGRVDMNLEVTYRKSDGETFVNTVKDILFHVVNHSTYHRAQIASLLKAESIDPPVTDYIILKREKQL